MYVVALTFSSFVADAFEGVRLIDILLLLKDEIDFSSDDESDLDNDSDRFLDDYDDNYISIYNANLLLRPCFETCGCGVGLV